MNLNRAPKKLHKQKRKAVAVGASMSDASRTLVRHYIATLRWQSANASVIADESLSSDIPPQHDGNSVAA